MFVMKFRRFFSEGTKRSMKSDFLSKIKPLLIFNKIFGILPVSNNNKYKICSVSWMWSFSCIILQCVMLFVYQESTWKKFVFPYNLVRTLLVSLLILIEGRKLTKIIDKFCLFDSMYDEIYCESVKTGWLQRSWSWVIITSIEMIPYYNFAMFYAGFTIISSFFDLLSFMTRQNWMHLYIFFCWNIVSRIQNLTEQWNHQVDIILRSKMMSVSTVTNENSLEKTRIVYFQLCEIIDTISKAFGSIIIGIILSICTDTLIDVYVFFFTKGGNRVAQFFYPVLANYTLYMLCSVSGQINVQVRHFSINYLNRLLNL